MATSPRLLVVLFLILATAPALSIAERLVVGDRNRWATNVNYTHWANRHEFHVGDWLEFDYEKDRYDVVQVNETAYEKCDASSPIVSYSRGRNFVFQLNHTGRLYFICSRGYCWNGMKVSVLVQPAPPPPAVAPSSHASRARAAAGVWRWAALTAGGRGGGGGVVALSGVNGKAQAGSSQAPGLRAGLPDIIYSCCLLPCYPFLAG